MPLFFHVPTDLRAVFAVQAIMNPMVLDYFENFSAAFRMTLLIWPLAALAVTIPVLAFLYRRHGRIRLPGIIGVYLAIWYFLALVAVTLYPLPDNPAQYCAAHDFPAQTQLFYSFELVAAGARIVLLQTLFNVLLFVPFGFMVGRAFKRGILWSILVSAAVSTVLEVAQLTGLFHVYPCAYRSFDVDDIWFNTVGGVLGAIIGWIYRRIAQGGGGDSAKGAAEPAITSSPSFLRRCVTLALDLALVAALAFPTSVLIDLQGVDWVPFLDDRVMCWVASLAIFEFLVPFFSRHGQTCGGMFTRMSVETRPRVGLRRFGFFALRFACLSLVLALCIIWVSQLSLAIVIVLGLVTLLIRQPPYDWV